MGILREIMGILRNFTDPKLWVLNYGFFFGKKPGFLRQLWVFLRKLRVFLRLRELRVFSSNNKQSSTNSNIVWFKA